jgi:site-specific DNA recombinase
MRRALVYCRISQDREGAGLGVARQREDCEQLVTKLGWELIDIYVDNDVSASTGRVRPEYVRLLADLRAGRGDAVVAWHADRLHRSPRELEEFIDVVEKARAAVATVRAGDLDLTTPAGRAVARTLGAWARYETEARVERTKRKNDQLAEAGAFQGGARPFGYEADGLTVRPDEAELLAAITADAIAGKALRQIARELNEQEILTAVGKSWGGVQVRQLILRPRNAGLRQHRGAVVGKAAWPAIVPEDQWRQAVELISNRHKQPSWINTYRHLGSGIYLCGSCGETCHVTTATTRKGTSRQVYRCRVDTKLTRTPGVTHVARHIVPVDELVTNVIVTRLSRHDAVDLLVPVDDSALEVVNEVADLRGRMSALAVDFADGVLTVEQIKAMTVRMRERIEELERRLPAHPTPAALAELAAYF